jgi:hypothetical protein
MPFWLLRLVWKVRGKRMVRVHCEDRPHTPVTTFEGILAGLHGGHYVLLAAKGLKGVEDSVSFEGILEIPADRVTCVQVLTS